MVFSLNETKRRQQRKEENKKRKRKEKEKKRTCSTLSSSPSKPESESLLGGLPTTPRDPESCGLSRVGVGEL
jgi:hypothetical protein